MDLSEKSGSLRHHESETGGARRPRRLFHFCFGAALLLLVVLQSQHYMPWLINRTFSPHAAETLRCELQSQWAESYSFNDLTNFSVQQSFQTPFPVWPRVRVTNGTIVLRPGPDTQKADVEVAVSVNATDSWITDRVQVEQTHQNIILSLPQYGPTIDLCLEFSMDITFKPGLKLETLKLEGSVASIVIDNATGLSVSNHTKVATQVGNIWSTGFPDSVDSYISPTHGSIHGNYSLGRFLGMHTQTGNVIAQIAPNTTTSIEHEDAYLGISSRSGMLDINYPYEGFGHLAERSYFTAISVGTGVIRGRYLLGAETNLWSATGSIDVDVLPYLVTDTSALNSRSTTGSQDVRVLIPQRSGITKIGNLKSKHHTTTGRLALQYPKEWAGSLYGETTTGRISIDGDFDDFEKGSKGFLGKWIKARRGDGESDLSFETTTGSASLVLV